MTFRRFSRIATALAVLAILAGPAWSARVVEVRVGNHPTFTRVVFELDAPAGYRIERRDVADGGQELVVKLDAASAPKKLAWRSPVVGGVALEQSGAQSVARVQLRGGSPRVKELILGGPPRIVLDFMLPEKPVASESGSLPTVSGQAPAQPVARKPAAQASAAATTVIAKKDAPEAAARPAQKAEKPEPAQKVQKPQPSDVAQKAQRPQASEPARQEQPPVAAPKVVAPSTAPKAAESSIAKVEKALEDERIVEPKVVRPDAPSPTELASPAPEADPSATPAPKPAGKLPTTAPPAPVAKAPTAPAPMRSKAEPSGPFGLDLGGFESWLPLGLVAVGLVLFLFVVVRILRRNSKPTSLDALEIARESGEPMESEDAFATIAAAGKDADAQPETSFPVAGPGLFDDEREKGESEMDVAMDLPIEREARPAPMASDSASSPLLEELERRMAQLESRLDAANEARERLERQVTAQSEELRVQRAAIARTQRALRGMTRIGDEQATEPALRDPAKPSSSRG